MGPDTLLMDPWALMEECLVAMRETTLVLDGLVIVDMIDLEVGVLVMIGAILHEHMKEDLRCQVPILQLTIALWMALMDTPGGIQVQ